MSLDHDPKSKGAKIRSLNPHCRATGGHNVPKVGNGSLSLTLVQKRRAPTLASCQRRLPMTSEDYSGADVGGNPYGTQLDSRQPWSAPFWDVM